MSLNCKPGDLAWCKGGIKSYGRIVKIGRAADDKELLASKCGTEIMIRPLSPGWVLSEGYLVHNTSQGQFDVPFGLDSYLVPFKGLDELERETLHLNLPEEVAA